VVNPLVGVAKNPATSDFDQFSNVDGRGEGILKLIQNMDKKMDSMAVDY
jgi:hypothetical protein